ncbi:hypothetical protein [Sandarakinorhabdus sp.]|uniref:hypothetical protein n=1 Tax=Sandarakinorhabdus sp. TaxID=1916663 RepID=UPI00286DAFD5|nr:hypothetical protein [Sandarakinorhabdus sp.]
MTISLGIYMGVLYLRGRRSPRMVAAIHFLTGAGGFEAMFLLLRGAPDPAWGSLIGNGKLAGLMLAMALLSGIGMSLLTQARPAALGPALLAHAVVGGGAFAMLLTWAVMVSF